MKRIIYLLICIVLALNARSQVITNAEYYIDTEPGLGLGTPIPITPGEEADFSFSASVEGLNPGFHYMYVRVLNDSGYWSMQDGRPFFLYQPEIITDEVVAGEYFVDADPGIGNGIPLFVNAGEDIDQTWVFDIGVLAPGFHYVGVRFKNASGFWGLNDMRPVFVIDGTAVATNIVAGEFFVDAEPGIGNGTPFTVNIADSLVQDISLDLPDLSLGTHTLYIRLQNEEGHWSMNEPRTFSICETYGSVADFSFVQNSNLYSFENNSQFADSISWDLGDGTITSATNPVHFYAESGVYNVKLTTFNNCANDTLIEVITIEGLENVVPSVVSDASYSTVAIHGFGFTDGTTALFKRDGFPDLVPAVLTVVNSYTMIAVVNFTGAATGFWNLEVNIPLEGILTLDNALNVISVPDVSTNLIMTPTYSTLVRTGRLQHGQVEIKNDNYTDAIGVILLARDKVGMEQQMHSPISGLTNIPFFAEAYQFCLDNDISNTVFAFNGTHDDTESLTGGFIIPKIAGQSEYNALLRMRRTIDGDHQHGNLMTYPQLTTASQGGTIEYQNQICLGSFMLQAVHDVMSVDIDPGDWMPCFEQWNDTLWTTIASLAITPGESSNAISFPGSLSAILTHMIDSGCVPELENITSDQFKDVVMHVVSNMGYLHSIDGIGEQCSEVQMMEVFDEEISLEQTLRTNEFCDEVEAFGGIGIFSSMSAASAICIKNSGAVDPNVKYGVGDNENDVYIDPGQQAFYNITFENDSSATAPVEFLSIVDSLDAVKFELSSFRWSPISLGDSLYIIPEPEEYYQLIMTDLRPDLPYYLMTMLHYDSLEAVVHWDIATVDTLNYQPLDTLDGFLPPNLNGDEGSGQVGFFINFNNELANGDTVYNQASITFDFDEPIITPWWKNVMDNELPTSNVIPLPATYPDETFNVEWEGEDNVSGIKSFSIFVSENDGPFLPWMVVTDTTASDFTGIMGNSYKFFSIATDHAGNVEAAPEDPHQFPDAEIHLTTLVTELSDDMFISVYPVPAHDEVMVEVKLEIPGNGMISLYDAQGKKILSDNFVSSATGIVKQRVDISSVAAGLYMLQIEMKTTSGAMRILKE